ncbi:MAG: exosortase [Gemmatimonadetes bacterium]|nr:exosortase [Gemmatimonadota bacterium]
MTAASLPVPRPQALPLAAALAGTFIWLFARPAAEVASAWWNDPEAGHGLLLFPVACWLAWNRGLEATWRPARLAGGVLLGGAVGVRYLSELAAELFTMRLSVVAAIAGLVLWYVGWAQLRRWWLPVALLALSIPLPSLLVASIALPLQFTASKIGAALLTWREIPVLLIGNVIRLPGRELFVAEACSGLRSLTALLSLSVLVGGMLLRSVTGRTLLVAAAIPVAVLLNGLRVFLTGFLVTVVDPRLGEGFLHLSEGWLIFVVALAILALLAWGIGAAEDAIAARRAGGSDTRSSMAGALEVADGSLA